jgi:lipopolysaccharide cholinephosphotransferase
MIEKSKSCRSSWVRILMFPTPNDSYGYLAKWYQGGEDILFEGELFPAVKDADEYLRFKFGDYMTLPPPEERKVHPVSAFALPEQE